MRFGFVTLFPEVIAAYMGSSILGRATQKGLISWDTANPRDFAYDAHKKVDDTPYGGEAGMLMRVEPVALALSSLLGFSPATPAQSQKDLPHRTAVVVTEPGGKRFEQADARSLAEMKQVIFVCGHYEGIDHRFEEAFATRVYSVGDFVLTGGELPALVMADAAARNVRGVLGSAESLAADSFGEEGVISAPNYTRPPLWRGRAVPEILLSGDHARIAKWRAQMSRERTLAREPKYDPENLLEYDRWANLTIGRTIEAYGEEAQARYRHILESLATWSERMGEPTVAEWEEVYKALRRARARFRPSEHIYYRNSKGHPRWRTVRRIVQHLALHGAYHRGEIRRLAEQAGAYFPETDLIYHDDVGRDTLREDWERETGARPWPDRA